MSGLLKKILKLPPNAQRGDTGALYIIFIMFIIVCAAFVMVGGLNPEFKDLDGTNGGGTSQFFDDPDDSLPPLPDPNSPEYDKMRECAAQARKGLSNKEIAEGKRMPIDSDCPQSSLL